MHRSDSATPLSTALTLAAGLALAGCAADAASGPSFREVAPELRLVVTREPVSAPAAGFFGGTIATVWMAHAGALLPITEADLSRWKVDRARVLAEVLRDHPFVCAPAGDGWTCPLQALLDAEVVRALGPTVVARVDPSADGLVAIVHRVAGEPPPLGEGPTGLAFPWLFVDGALDTGPRGAALERAWRDAVAERMRSTPPVEAPPTETVSSRPDGYLDASLAFRDPHPTVTCPVPCVVGVGVPAFASDAAVVAAHCSYGDTAALVSGLRGPWPVLPLPAWRTLRCDRDGLDEARLPAAMPASASPEGVALPAVPLPEGPPGRCLAQPVVDRGVVSGARAVSGCPAALVAAAGRAWRGARLPAAGVVGLDAQLVGYATEVGADGPRYGDGPPAAAPGGELPLVFEPVAAEARVAFVLDADGTPLGLSLWPPVPRAPARKAWDLYRVDVTDAVGALDLEARLMRWRWRPGAPARRVVLDLSETGVVRVARDVVPAPPAAEGGLVLPSLEVSTPEYVGGRSTLRLHRDGGVEVARTEAATDWVLAFDRDLPWAAAHRWVSWAASAPSADLPDPYGTRGLLAAVDDAPPHPSTVRGSTLFVGPLPEEADLRLDGTEWPPKDRAALTAALEATGTARVVVAIEPDPSATWEEVVRSVERVREAATRTRLQSVHVVVALPPAGGSPVALPGGPRVRAPVATFPESLRARHARDASCSVRAQVVAGRATSAEVADCTVPELAEAVRGAALASEWAPDATGPAVYAVTVTDPTPILTSADLRVVDAPAPAFPDGARGHAICPVALRVGADGRAHDVVVSACEEPFRSATAAAIASWRWEPPARPVETTERVPFRDPAYRRGLPEVSGLDRELPTCRVRDADVPAWVHAVGASCTIFADVDRRRRATAVTVRQCDPLVADTVAEAVAAWRFEVPGPCVMNARFSR